MHTQNNNEFDNIVSTILVVDDDEQLRELYRYKLEEEGFHVFEAASGQEAVSVYHQNMPTLILMDAVMPEMDGFDACQQILDAAGEDKPIVLIATALDDDKSVNKAFSAGAADYITKPIHWAVLTNRIKHLLQAATAEKYRQRYELQKHHARKISAIHRMVGGIAHDFNNLLTGVIGYSELALELTPEKSVRLKTYLTEIERAGGRAKSLIQKLLTFSQDTPGTLVPTAPESIVHEALQMLGESFPETLSIAEDIDNDLPQILMDPVHIYQSIVNLCLNAKEAMNGHGTITVDMHKVKVNEQRCASCLTEFSGEYLELSVHDSGKGIDEKNLSHIFDPFFTTHEVSTGLGLSVVHGIVHEHRGHIKVDSVLQQGTTFRLYLPIS